MAYDSEISQKSRDLIVLEKARAILAKGWCQHALADGNGNHCLVGALNVAMIGREQGGDFWKLLPHLGLDCETVLDFNNAPHRSKSEVLARFDEAIARLAGQP